MERDAGWKKTAGRPRLRWIDELIASALKTLNIDDVGENMMERDRWTVSQDPPWIVNIRKEREID